MLWMVSPSLECYPASSTLGTLSQKNYGAFVMNSGPGRNCHLKNEYNNSPLPNSDIMRYSGTVAVEVTHTIKEGY